MPASSSAVEVTGRITGEHLDEVRALIEAATVADGVRPLSEHVMLHLRHGGDEASRNLLARGADGAVVGYAHLDVTDEVAGPSAELVVHPMHRGRGHGRALVEAATRTADEQTAQHGSHPASLRLWSHGSHRSARELASRMGFTSARSLWQMRRSLYAPIPDVELPPGILARTFEPGRDEQAWLEVNVRAFAEHPEQGGWTRDDLDRRMAESWFDPNGFFLAERDGGMAAAAGGGAGAVEGASRLVGFHWTKVHGGHPSRDHDHLGPHEHDPGAHGHEPIGEVYALGVDPAERGTGVGRALTALGLSHLRSLGLAQAMLYVDETNKEAIGLYESLGFAHWDTDVLYARA